MKSKELVMAEMMSRYLPDGAKVTVYERVKAAPKAADGRDVLKEFMQRRKAARQSSQSSEQMNNNLQRLMQRLDSIERRLQNAERVQQRGKRLKSMTPKIYC